MSIIYDALQKTQRKRMTAQGEAANSTSELAAKPIMSYSTRLLFIILGTIICMLALAKVFSVITAPKLAPAPKPVKQKIALPTPNPAKFTLNGLFISKEEKLVVINNKTLHEGDMINGAKILHITANRVILSQYGKAFALKSDLSSN